MRRVAGMFDNPVQDGGAIGGPRHSTSSGYIFGHQIGLFYVRSLPRIRPRPALLTQSMRNVRTPRLES